MLPWYDLHFRRDQLQTHKPHHKRSVRVPAHRGNDSVVSATAAVRSIGREFDSSYSCLHGRQEFS
jgi:hypothetical protein